MLNSTLDITTLEKWLREAACKIRGEIDAPRFKYHVLSSTFHKRPSDIFEDKISILQPEKKGIS